MKNNLENIAQELIRIIRESLYACHPEQKIADTLQKIHTKQPFGLFAFGKSAISMTEAFLKITPVRSEFSLVLSSPQYVPVTYNKEITLFFGNHPYPGKETEQSSHIILNKLIRDIPPEGEIVLLISGGGSSLFEIPEYPYSIEQIAAVTKELMLKGANIYELNTVRKHLSSVKGGKLAGLLYPRRIVALIMSDVMGDNPEFIASGPVSPHHSDAKFLSTILKKYEIDARINKDNSGKTNDHSFEHVETHIILNNHSLRSACESLLEEKTFPVIKLPYSLESEARQCGEKIAGSIISSVKGIKEPFFILTGGECSVTVKGSGKGGRNLELVLGTALRLADCPFRWIIASIGSDGIDGPTDAAGGWLSSDLFNSTDRIRAEKALENNDTYPLFNHIQTLIKTGYTGINLNDLFLAYIEP